MEIKTTFILGAGASKPYSFPSGLELKNDIIQSLKDKNSKYFTNLLEIGFTEIEIKKFRESLYYCSTFSIDQFLEKNEKYIQIGKSCIAQILLAKENARNLFETPNSWYQYLFNKINQTFENIDKQNIAFLTFNYDRSLEHFLFTSTQNLFDKNDVDVADKIQKIPLVHLHGQLGYLFWQDNQNFEIPYRINTHENHITIEDVKRAANSIKIISDNIDVNKDEQFILARQILKNSERIIFLGFGYNATNIERLEINKLKDTHILGTAYGLNGQQIEEIKGRIGKENQNVQLRNDDIYNLLIHTKLY